METCSLGLLVTLILHIHVIINWQLSNQGIRWPVSRDYIAGSNVMEVNRWFSIGSQAHVRLTCWKQGRIVWKPVNASSGLKFIRIITFPSINVFCWFVLSIWWLKNSKQKVKQYTENLTAKLQNSINILPFPGLPQLGTEQPRQGATL